MLPAVCARLVALTCALVVLCSVTRARAAAPMCDHLPQTIAAPATLKPIPDRKLAVTRCASDALEQLGSLPSPDERAPKLSVDVVQRVLPAAQPLCLEAPRTSERVPLERERRAGSSFLAEIYRPPRF
jgi:hypothetical protein